MNKVLITGVAGFIGSHVARRFLQEEYSVVGIDDLSSGKMSNIPEGVSFIQGDLARKETMELIPGDCRKILHLAGQSSGEISFDDPIADLEKNAVSTLNLIKYGIENRIERIVYASSMSVYGAVADIPINEDCQCKPISCYGIGKLAAENYLRVYMRKIPSVSLRMFNVYGPGQDMNNFRQGMVSIYLAQALSNNSIEVKGGAERFRDFIYIDDVVEAWWRAATYSSVLGQTLNVGTGVRTTVAELLNRIKLLVPGSEYFINGGTPGDQSGIYANISNLRDCLGMSCFTKLDDGLGIFADWARQRIALTD